jgi:hypothetical protein
VLKAFLKKYKRPILWVLVGYAIVMAVLILLAAGPQSEPFLYQLF